MKQAITPPVKHTVYRYNNIDFLKFICAFLVVCIHSQYGPFSGILGMYISAIARIAVPIFFMISGFFYERNAQRENRQIIKILKLILISSCLYIVWDYVFSHSGKTISEYLYSIYNIDAIRHLLLFNITQNGGHLWYLFALFYVLIIAKVLNRFNKPNYMFWLIPILLFIGLLLGRYSLLLLDIKVPLRYSRNFIFCGLPYFFLGMAIKQHENKIKDWAANRKLLLIISIAIFTLTTLLECKLLFMKADQVGDLYLSTTFLAISVFILSLVCKNMNAKNQFVLIGRNESTMIYIIHVSIIEILSSIGKQIPNIEIFLSYTLPIAVFLLSIVLAKLHGATVKSLKAKHIIDTKIHS